MKCQVSDSCKSIIVHWIIWYSLTNEPRKIFHNSSENEWVLFSPATCEEPHEQKQTWDVFEIRLLSACFLGYPRMAVSWFPAAVLSAWLLGCGDCRALGLLRCGDSRALGLLAKPRNLVKGFLFLSNSCSSWQPVSDEQNTLNITQPLGGAVWAGSSLASGKWCLKSC